MRPAQPSCGKTPGPAPRVLGGSVPAQGTPSYAVPGAGRAVAWMMVRCLLSSFGVFSLAALHFHHPGTSWKPAST